MGRTSLFFLAGFVLVGIMSNVPFVQSAPLSAPGMVNTDVMANKCRKILELNSEAKINVRVLIRLLLNAPLTLTPAETESMIDKACSPANIAPGQSGVVNVSAMLSLVINVQLMLGDLVNIILIIQLLIQLSLGINLSVG